MNYLKKLIFISMAFAVMVISFFGHNICFAAAETNEDSNSYITDSVGALCTAYSEYYRISDVNIKPVCKNDKMIMIELKATLLEDCVEKLDYMKGVLQFQKENENSTNAALIHATIEKLSKQFEEYIGVNDTLTFYAKDCVNKETGERYLAFENGDTFVDVDGIFPQDHDYLYESGYAYMKNMCEQCEDVVWNGDLKLVGGVILPPNSFSETLAVSYMTTYTSNPSTCNACGASNCGHYVDITKYNSTYANYASSHSDCANYVSQALSAGGLSTDTTWRAGTAAWINVSRLTNYMTSNGHWTTVLPNQVGLSDVISFKSYSHVVMITSFNGVTYKYSGHTNDRKNVTISLNNSSHTCYRVSN